MPMFPISATAKRTGIPLDTLRAWERRYEAVTPKRGTRGRMYSEEQVQRLLLLRQAVDRGHAIGQVAKFGDRQLRKLVDHSTVSTLGGAQEKASRTRLGTTTQQRDMLAPVFRALDRYDYAEADREINRLAATMARPREFVYDVALPLMRTIGQLWHQGRSSIAQEHMLTNLLSAVLGSMVRTFTPTDPPARVLLATPREDRHAFPTLVAAMLTAAAGLGLIYLGADLPAEDIVLAARRSEANAILLSLSTTPSPETLQELGYVSRKLSRSAALWLGGAKELKLSQDMVGPRWILMDTFGVLEHHLSNLVKLAQPSAAQSAGWSRPY